MGLTPMREAKDIVELFDESAHVQCVLWLASVISQYKQAQR